METEKRRAFIINFIYFLLLIGLAVAAVKYGLPLISPFVVAVVISALLRRPVRFFSKRLKLNQRPVAIVMVILFYALIGVLISLLGVRVVSAVGALVSSLPSLYSNYIQPALTEVFDSLEKLMISVDSSLFSAIEAMESRLLQAAADMVSNLSVSAISVISGAAYSLPGLFVELVLLIISTFFISADYERLANFCINQLDDRGRDIFFQVKGYVIGTLFVCIRSYILIMSITFVELFLGLSLIGVEHAVLVAALIAVFDILPVLGTGGIMIPWTLIEVVRGEFSMALGLGVVYVAITVIRNIIEPKIVGGQLGLHPVVTLASMFAGVQLLGVVGLFGFPILLSLLRHLSDNGTIRLFKPSPRPERDEET